jgi:hypothetical protein
MISAFSALPAEEPSKQQSAAAVELQQLHLKPRRDQVSLTFSFNSLIDEHKAATKAALELRRLYMILNKI